MHHTHLRTWNEPCRARGTTAQRLRTLAAAALGLTAAQVQADVETEGLTAVANATGATCSRPDAAGAWTCHVPNGSGGFASITGPAGSGASPDFAALGAWTASNLGANALAMGVNAAARTNGSVAIGQGASTLLSPLQNTAINQGERAVAIGFGATAAMQSSLALGTNASTNLIPGSTTASGAVAIGSNAQANGNRTTTIGADSGVGTSGLDNTTVGINSGRNGQSLAAAANGGVAVQNTGNVTVGLNAGNNVTGANNVALGLNAGNNVRANTDATQANCAFTPFYCHGGGGNGTNNTGIGNGSGTDVQGALNTGIGWRAGAAVNGFNNVGIGPLGGFMVTGTNNIGIGSFGGQAVTGSRNVAMGNGAGSSVTGDRNIALGDGAGSGIAANDAISAGTRASASANGAIALGANASASTANSVALGAGSTAGTATGVSGTTILGTGYGFAGSSPGSVVSVGSAGNERQIQNVAAGRLGADSTDAVNGSQLHATNQALESLSATASAGINVTTAAMGTGVARGSSMANVGSGSAATYTAGDNMVLTQNGTNVAFAVSAAPSFSSVAVGATHVASDGVRIQGGPSMTTAGIDAGGQAVTNVAPGVAGTDAANVDQLNQSVGAVNRQLNDVHHQIASNRRDANAGTAGAMAMAGMPQAYMPGKSMVAAGAGYYEGQSAVAIGVSKISNNGKWVTKFTGSANTRGNLGVSAGVGYQW